MGGHPGGMRCSFRAQDGECRTGERKMENSDIVLRPRLTGKRFDKHDIPLAVLKDLASFEGIIRKAAKNAFFRENKDKSRVPPGFLKGFSLNIAGVKEGSAIPEFRIQYDDRELFKDKTLSHKYLEIGINDLYDLMEKASNSDEEITGISKEDASELAKIGKSLREDEQIEFVRNGKIIPFNSRSRLAFLKASRDESISETKHFVGLVIEVDTEKCTFMLRLVSGKSITAKLPSGRDDYYAVTDSLTSSRTQSPRKISMDCVVKSDRKGMVLEVESIEQIALLDARDVPSRLLEFSYLKDGWLEGSGESFDAKNLTLLGDMFSNHYPPEWALPYTYPNENKNIIWEWENDEHSVSLHVSTETFAGEWFDYNNKTDDIFELRFNDLRTKETWDEIIASLKKLGVTQ